MTTTKPGKRKRLAKIVGVAAAIVAAAAIGAGTYASFTDTETSGNTAAAGTLDLDFGTTPAQLFTGSNIAPGYSRTVPLTVRNTGNINGILNATMAVIGGDGVCTEPEAAAEAVEGGGCNPSGNLQDEMTVTVNGGEPVSLAAFASAGLHTISIPAGQTVTLDLVFALPTSADNKVQGDTVQLNSSFTLDQA